MERAERGKSRGSEDYLALADEVSARLGMAQPQARAA